MKVKRLFRCFLAGALAVQGIMPPMLTAGELFGGWSKTRARVKTPAEDLAATIDALEKQLDVYGSVVVKQPDLYGEARWTKHRQEYERQLSNELGNFKFTVNAREREADTAFFLNATALGAALQSDSSGKAPTASVQQVFTPPTGTTGGFPQFTPIDMPTATVVARDGTEVKGVALEPVLFLDQMSRYLDHLNQLRRINEGDDTADAPGYALNLIRVPVSILPGNQTRTGFGAEVTLTLTPELSIDLLPETFKDLALNDVVDQLGLPIVKLAEQRPWVGEETRGLYLSLDRAAFEEAKKILDGMDPEAIDPKQLKAVADIFDRTIGASGEKTLNAVPPEARDAVRNYRNMVRAPIVHVLSLGGPAELNRMLAEWMALGELKSAFLAMKGNATSEPEMVVATSLLKSRLSTVLLQEEEKGRLKELTIANAKVPLEALSNIVDENVEDRGKLLQAANVFIAEVENGEIKTQLGLAKEIDPPAISKALAGAIQSLAAAKTVTLVASPRHRQARYPIAPTEIVCVFGEEELTCVAKAVAEAADANGESRVHLMDVHSFLTEELEAAHALLLSLRNEGVCDAWGMFCPRISRAIRQLDYNGSVDPLVLIRSQFRHAVGWTTPNDDDSCKGCTVRALAWAILVESALLHDRLVQDMDRVQKARGCPILPDCPLAFYGPDPAPEAREAFNAYVRCRWPIHVFAIDPVNQEQNVSEAYARRRETQLALALAFTGGQISGDNFSRYARRLDYELQTIELNRTVVGFSHGDDTFGWRITPRVQAPPPEGNARVLVRDLICGPKRDAELKLRQLEPGMRELLAIVIMPSFVPHLRMDVRSNWFRLTDPQRKQFTTEDSVRLGQMVQFVRQCKAQCIAEDETTRPGDLRRLLVAVDQLEKRLSLQDTLVQIPYQNAQGGFRLFADGTKNLAPELIGYYGEPGYNPKTGTDLFLVGHQFNVNVTKVVIGGQDCEYDLLSREVMKVKIKKDAQTTTIQRNVKGTMVSELVVDAHVGTPYGVSSHLYIPVVSQAPSSGPTFTFNPLEVFGCVYYDGCTATSVSLSPANIEMTGIDKGKVADVTLQVRAILSNGTERELQYTVIKAGAEVDEKAIMFSVLSDAATGKVNLRTAGGGLEAILRSFLTGRRPLLAQEQPIALKVNGTVKVQGMEAVAIAGQLLIKLGGGAAVPGCAPCVTPACCESIVPSIPPSAGFRPQSPAATVGSRSTYRTVLGLDAPHREAPSTPESIFADDRHPLLVPDVTGAGN